MFTNNFKLSGIEDILGEIGYMSEETKDENDAGEDQEKKYKKSGKKSKDYDGDGTVEDESHEYAGVKDRAIKKAMKKEEVEKKDDEDEKEDDEMKGKKAKKEKEDEDEKEDEKEKKESVDFSSVLDELTDEEVIFLSDTLIEEVVEEFFYETLEEGFEIDELETLLIEHIESELTYLEEAKVTVGHDSNSEVSRPSRLAKVKAAVKKVASGAKAVAKKVAGAAGEVAGSAVAGYKKASAAASDAPGGRERDDSTKDSPNTGSRSSGSSSSSGTKRPGILGRVGAALKSGLKKAIRGAGKAAGKVVKTAKAGYDEGRGKSAPAAKPAATPAAKPAAKKPAEKPADPWKGSESTPPKAKPAAKKPAAKAATAKKKSKSNLDNLLSQIRNEEVEQIEEKAPPGAKYERMVKHIKAGYKKGGVSEKEKGIAYATAWKAYNKEEVELDEEQGPCWKGYEMVGMKKKGGKEVPNCVPMKEYAELAADMILEGYEEEQVREVIAAIEDGFEVIFEEDQVVINDTAEQLDEEVLDEEAQFLSDVEVVADWLYAEGIIQNEDEFFELMEDLDEDEIEELYSLVMEAEGSYGKTPKASAAYSALVRKRTNKPASEYSKKGEKTKKVKSAEKHMWRSLRGGPHHGRGKMTADDRTERRSERAFDLETSYGSGSVTKNPKKLRKQKAMGEIGENYMIGDSLDNGGLEVRNYSWREVLESKVKF